MCQKNKIKKGTNQLYKLYIKRIKSIFSHRNNGDCESKRYIFAHVRRPAIDSWYLGRAGQIGTPPLNPFDDGFDPPRLNQTNKLFNQIPPATAGIFFWFFVTVCWILVKVWCSFRGVSAPHPHTAHVCDLDCWRRLSCVYLDTILIDQGRTISASSHPRTYEFR